MKIAITALWALAGFVSCAPRNNGPERLFETDNPRVNEAWELAEKTVRYNIRDSILAAGADYGGEWTRDVAINTWNGTDLFIPEVVERSLWHVTEERQTIGHQYWDKIIWVQGAWYHYLLTRDREFLAQAYACGSRTIEQLEATAFDREYGLFTGSSVFNDGISAFEEPIYDPARSDLSGVMRHHTHGIKCLSTNCVYYMAYRALDGMHRVLHGTDHEAYADRAEALRLRIRSHFYNPRGKLFYAIDEQGGVHRHQEALGNAFAILSGVITPEEGHYTLIRNETTPFGVPSVTPIFKRFSLERPGRHNRLIWPFVNAFYARAALLTGDRDIFEHELNAMAALALDEDKGNYNFYEIFDPRTGKPEGGNQAGRDRWHSRRHQTWSATGYMSMILYGVCGLHPGPEGMEFRPYLPRGINRLSINGLKYGGMVLDLDLQGDGDHIEEVRIDGARTARAFLPADGTGRRRIEIRVSRPRFP